MKKFIIILAALLAATMLLVSCSKDEDEGAATPNNKEETVYTIVEDIPATIDKIYEKFPVELRLGTIEADIIDGRFEYYTGLTDNSKLHSYAVSETMIGSQAYSMVMVNVKEGEDVKAVADAMMNGIDPNKWICVGADLIRTVTHGSTVMLVMIDSQFELDINGFVTAFEEVVGKVEYEAKRG